MPSQHQHHQHHNQNSERARAAADSLVEALVFLAQSVQEQSGQIARLNQNLENLNIVIAQSSPGGLDALAGIAGKFFKGMKGR